MTSARELKVGIANASRSLQGYQHHAATMAHELDNLTAQVAFLLQDSASDRLAGEGLRAIGEAHEHLRIAVVALQIARNKLDLYNQHI
jgi:hypothetical protein